MAARTLDMHEIGGAKIADARVGRTVALRVPEGYTHTLVGECRQLILTKGRYQADHKKL
jgi:hypothetical protein